MKATAKSMQAAHRLRREIDGQVHDHPDRSRRDSARDELIKSLGLRVQRICAAEVMHDVAGVASAIVELCRAGPLHHPAAPDGPPPQPSAREEPR